MGKITLITGGVRSGKSSYAQTLALETCSNPVYLATSRVWDKDFEQRIKRHQSDRDDRWETIEEDKALDKLTIQNRTVVIDCITLWLTNIYHDNNYHLENSLKEAQHIWDRFITKDVNIIAVTNEVGMSLHADTEIGRKFADLQGWLNQYIAKSADTVCLVVTGIPVKIK